MSVDFKVHPRHSLCIVKCSGEMTESDLYDFRSAIMLDENLASMPMRLFDARTVTRTSFSPFTLWRLMSYSPPVKLRRVFVLPPKGVDRLAYRMATRFAVGRINLHVCFDMREALDWLQIADADVVMAELAA